MQGPLGRTTEEGGEATSTSSPTGSPTCSTLSSSTCGFGLVSIISPVKLGIEPTHLQLQQHRLQEEQPGHQQQHHLQQRPQPSYHPFPDGVGRPKQQSKQRGPNTREVSVVMKKGATSLVIDLRER